MDSGGPCHGEQGVGAALGFGAGEVVGGCGVAEAVAGVGPVGVPFGFDEPGEDLVELAAGELGKVPGDRPAALGAGTHPDVTVGVQAFVAGEVAVRVGERFPPAGASFELVERLADRIVQECRRVTLQHRSGDARVGCDACHQLRLGDADTAVGFGVGPLGPVVVQAGGLHTTMRFRSGQSAHVLHVVFAERKPWLAERVRSVDHPSGGDRSGLDGTAQRLDVFQPCPQLGGVELRRIHLRHRRQRRRCPRRSVACPVGRRLSLDVGDQTQPDRLQPLDARRHAITSAACGELVDVNRTHAPHHDEGVSQR